MATVTPISVRSSFSTPKSFAKFPSGKPFLKESKQIILNVYSRLRENPSYTENGAVSEAARLTGVSESTIRRMKTEYRLNGKPRSPLRRTLNFDRMKTKRLNAFSKLDSFDKEAIRRKVHEYFSRNEIPTVKSILQTVNEDSSLPNMKRSSLYKIIKDLGFQFRRRKRDSALITRIELIDWRANYLKAIRDFRSAGKSIYYIDETWLNAGHTKERIWHDSTVKSAKQAWKSGLSAGLTGPSGKGSRLIVTHAGNENGFVTNALDIFQGKKGSGDYHDEMDGGRFQTWFTEKLLPNIKPNSVIVMDNASYHSVREERLPTTKTKKADIQIWLTSKGIIWTPQMLVKDLLALVQSVRSKYNSYSVDKRAEEAGHYVLRLPPYHCELNPIELIWSQVKGYAAARNKNFKIAEVRTLLEEGIARVSSTDWENCVKHVVEKVEPKFWKIDGLINVTMEPFIITNDDDSSDSHSSDSDSS